MQLRVKWPSKEKITASLEPKQINYLSEFFFNGASKGPFTFFLIVAFPTTDFLMESKFSQNFPLALLRIPHTLVQ